MGFKNGFLFACGALFALAAIFVIIGSTTAQNVPAATGLNSSLYSGTITVTGTGYVYADPDTAQVTIGVTNDATTSTQAMSDNAAAMSQVVSAIKALGIADKDIKTSTISLQPKYSYQYPTVKTEVYNTPAQTTTTGAVSPAIPVTPTPTVLTTQIVGYTATNTVTVTIHDLSLVGKVIDAGNSGGANQVSGVTFTLSDDLASSVYKQALQKAMTDGTGKAGVLASAAGIADYKLKSVSESGVYYPVAYEALNMAPMASGASTSTPVSPGQNKVSATVSLTYVYIPQ